MAGHRIGTAVETAVGAAVGTESPGTFVAMDDPMDPRGLEDEYRRVRNHHIRRAALDGAALGLLAGLLGGAYTDTHVPYLVTTSAIGIVVGAALAALIAALRRY